MAEQIPPVTSAAPEQTPEEAVNTEQTSAVQPGGVIVARAYRFYRLTRFGLVIFLLCYGAASIRDGFYKYPAENQTAMNQHLEKLPHPGFDVQFNKFFGVVLPPLAVAILIWSLYVSRGEYRFDGSTLSAPGHPPVPVAAITEIDRSKWDRKSIAYVHYQLPSGETGRIKFDHSLYDPVDKMFKQVELAVASG
jgi:hypothetical protein